MKRSLLIYIVVFCSLLTVAKSYAQNTSDTVIARIAYTTSDRTAILAKTVGAAKIDTLFQSFGGVQLKNLAVLASTRDGKSIMIGGKATFTNPINNSPDSAWAIARIDSPFHNTGFLNIISNPPSLGGAKILKTFTIDQANSLFHFVQDKMLPLGVLSPDEKSWFVTLSKTSPGNGNQWFYHGSFDGKGVIDSFYLDPTSAVGSAAAIDGYHMTNLCTSDDGNTMITVVFDQIQDDKPRAQVFSWTPNVGGGNFPFIASVISGPISGLRPGWNIDSSFAFALRVVRGQNPPVCELALTPNLKGDLAFYSFRSTGSISTINPTRTIARNVLPKGSDAKTLHFFTGITGNPSSPTDDKEVIANNNASGNGGDMMFSDGGDSLVFITCRSDGNATGPESGIYIYNFRDNSVTLVQNDPLRMERQPIFAGSVIHKYIGPPPPKYIPGIAILDSSVLDFGIDSIGDPAAQTFFKLKDTSASQVFIKSATFTGSGAGAFSLIAPTGLPVTVAARGFSTFVVAFTPTAAQPYSATLEIHYVDSLTSERDSILKINMSGTGVKKKPTGGVNASTPASFDLSVVPNPFTSSTNITITAREAASTSIEVRDLLGKDIYSSKQMMLGVGEKFTYSLDANALHLAPGTYFVIVRSGGDELTRQVIYIK